MDPIKITGNVGNGLKFIFFDLPKSVLELCSPVIDPLLRQIPGYETYEDFMHLYDTLNDPDASITDKIIAGGCTILPIFSHEMLELGIEIFGVVGSFFGGGEESPWTNSYWDGTGRLQNSKLDIIKYKKGLFNEAEYHFEKNNFGEMLLSKGKKSFNDSFYLADDGYKDGISYCSLTFCVDHKLKGNPDSHTFTRYLIINGNDIKSVSMDEYTKKIISLYSFE